MAEEPSSLETGSSADSSHTQGPVPPEIRQELSPNILVGYVRRMVVAMLQEGEDEGAEAKALDQCMDRREAKEAIRKYIRDAQEKTLQVAYDIFNMCAVDNAFSPMLLLQQ